jgi:hypothetical protein
MRCRCQAGASLPRAFGHLADGLGRAGARRAAGPIFGSQAFEATGVEGAGIGIGC